ncbi:MAG: acetamidase, partial [Spirochaetales bacterium]
MATHHFQPAAYHTSFGSHPPVLHIADGDTVVTTTLDAVGTDAAGRQAARGPNPQTGPFYIEGAEPGDTLMVHIDHLHPNRETGWSNSMLAAHVVDPVYSSKLPEERRVEWRILPDRHIAELITPLTGLQEFSLPLSPMLGCLGVAPSDGQAISSATSGQYGGNMDYRGCAAGTTFYIPVFVPGALFFLGDGHAAQGDGEVAGSGIEISFDVRFTAGVRKGRKI